MSKKKTEVFELYKIKWIDAATSAGWKSLDHEYSKDEDWEVTTVGWLIEDCKKYYVLATSLSNAYNSGDRWHIPKKWVQSVKKIKGHSISYVHD